MKLTHGMEMDLSNRRNQKHDWHEADSGMEVTILNYFTALNINQFTN